MRIKLIGGKYDGKTFIVPDATLRYHPEGTKEIAYENQGYRIGFDAVFKFIELPEETPCHSCKGRGYFFGITGYDSPIEGEARCIRCDGTGKVRGNGETK